jgi:replication factor C subunit 2/4
MSGKAHLWVEKYRPRDVGQIVQQDEIKVLLQQAIERRNLTHMLFYGPPGTGKTSTALALAKELFHLQRKQGEDTWSHVHRNERIFKERVMELNASDERGIKVVREKIKNFASSSINTMEDEGTIPPFKIIILDEADAMTTDSQFALRRIIEKYTNMTRFILICNYVTRIISPLASRCAKFRFQSISPPSIKAIIHRITEHEGIEVHQDAVDTLHAVTKGDLRKAINLLQRAAYSGRNVQSDTVTEIAGHVPRAKVDGVWAALSNKGTTMLQLMDLVKGFRSDAYSSVNLVAAMFERAVAEERIPNSQKASLILRMSDIDYCLNDNANEFIQLMRMFVHIRNAFA